MKYLIARDKNRRNLVKKFEINRLVYKAIWLNTALPFAIRYRAYIILSSLPKNSSKIRLTFRCVFTGRTRSSIKNWKMSRLRFRDFSRQGLLYGVKRASW